MNKSMTWDSISIGQFADIVKVSKSKDSDLEKAIRYYCIIHNISYDECTNMPIDKMTIKLKTLSFAAVEPKARFDGLKIDINGNRYNITPSAAQMTAGQFIDYQNTINSNNRDDLSLLCALFIIPEGKKYGDGYDVLELRDELNDHMCIRDALGISFFLQKSFTVLSTTILRSLVRKMKRAAKREKNPKAKMVILASIKETELAISTSESLSKSYNILT